ncbi:hypothetical protein NP493_1009g01007 [Ridgeia piscesae]|uniref:Secreted protein n=1 Tax=Ridgeia piscesae TaxID=27915 RepID=A0AAD9KIL9_RIDPI|nr:hypothetical protein NP493_1009g01007 [Ridgeia piscesae]
MATSCFHRTACTLSMQFVFSTSMLRLTRAVDSVLRQQENVFRVPNPDNLVYTTFHNCTKIKPNFSDYATLKPPSVLYTRLSHKCRLLSLQTHLICCVEQ